MSAISWHHEFPSVIVGQDHQRAGQERQRGQSIPLVRQTHSTRSPRGGNADVFGEHMRGVAENLHKNKYEELLILYVGSVFQHVN